MDASREVMRLHEEGFTIAEIASELRMGPDRVRMLIIAGWYDEQKKDEMRRRVEGRHKEPRQGGGQERSKRESHHV